MTLEGIPATLLEESQQESGIDMSALDDIWDLKGRKGDFSLVQLQHGSAAPSSSTLSVLYLRPCIGHCTSICHGSVVKLLE